MIYDMKYEFERYLSNSYLLLLRIDMVNDFSIENMQCVCLGIIKR